jgi:enediyne biosynthesis protein E4
MPDALKKVNIIYQNLMSKCYSLGSKLMVISVLIILACNTPEDKQTLFSRLASQSTGIDFNNFNVEDETQNVFSYEYFYNGGGVALGDVNNDGLVDIYFSANQVANRLYLNKGNFKFEDITLSSGTAAKDGWKTGVAMVDINADGLLDIYVCRSAANDPKWRKNILYINKGDLTFEDQAEAYGLADDSYSTHASFLDFDRDGDLDMFLLNHSVSSIVRNYDIRTENKTERVPYVGNKLFENRGGKFIDVSKDKGVFGPAHNYGLGVCYSDIDNDGWPDIYTSNDYTAPDNLLINNKALSFINKADTLLTHMSRFSMGTDIADVNNDGYPDIMTLDMLPDNNHRQKELLWAEQYDVYQEMVRNGLHHQFMRNMLHLNNGNGTFSEIGQFAGVSNTDWSWSALFADYDNDGLQDLFVSNGYKRDYTNNDFLKYRADKMTIGAGGKRIEHYGDLLNKMPSNKLHNYLFQNNNGLQFEDQSMSWGMGDATLTHGAAHGDLDNDGDLDLVLNNMDDQAGVYRNNSDSFKKNNFLKVTLSGNDGNRFGLGARVTLYVSGKLMMRELCPYRGFESTVEPALFFGLNKTETIDSVIVRWPRGERQKLLNVKCNQTLTVNQRDARQPDASETKFSIKPLFEEVQTNTNLFVHNENTFIDFKIQSLMPRMYSTEWPAMASGDVKNDGITDLYFGGAKGQSGRLYLGQKNGSYFEKPSPTFSKNISGEDVGALFFDMDGDHDLDLYVVTGGYEFSIDDQALQDKLYRNDGKGNFAEVPLPEFLSSGSCVAANDIDNDGDLDLFVGGRIIPGRYPESPESFILTNNGKGQFTIATEIVAPGLKKTGMITDAVWLDVNRDNRKDLVLAGEWMSIRVFINENGKLADRSKQYVPEKTEGWWNCILAHDFDQDGDDDLIIGNYGMNNQIKPTAEKPATLYYADFDDNNSIDPLLFSFVQGESYPFATRDELTEHLPSFKKKFVTYASYSDAGLNTVLSPEQLKKAATLTAYCLETIYLQNDGGSFSRKALPAQLQYAPVFALAAMDVNHDGHMDLVSGGNLSATKARTGTANGNKGFIFLGNGKSEFSFLPTLQSGINLSADVREIMVINNHIILGVNNGRSRLFKLNDQ